MHLLRCEPAFRLEFLSADFFLLEVTERRATGRTLRMLILIDVGAVALWLVLGCGAVPCSERSTSNELTPEDLPRQSGDLERARPAAAPIGAVSKPVGESRLCPSRMCRRPGDNRAGNRWILRGCSSGGGLAAPVGWLRCGSPSPGRPTSRRTRPSWGSRLCYPLAVFLVHQMARH